MSAVKFTFDLLSGPNKRYGEKIEKLTIAEKLNLNKSFEKSSLSKVAFCKEQFFQCFLILQSKDKLLSNTGGKTSQKRKQEGW